MSKMADHDERCEQIKTRNNLIFVEAAFISFVATLKIDMRKLLLLFYLKKKKTTSNRKD